MFKKSPLLLKAFNRTTSPINLLGLNRKSLNSIKSIKPINKLDHDLKLKDFILSSLSTYPLNFILTNRMLTNSLHLRNMVEDIDGIHKLYAESLNPEKPKNTIDPNDIPTLIDYKVIDKKFNSSLHSIFKKHFKILEISDEETEIIIISFTKEGLNNNISFFQDFRFKNLDFFDIKGCILNTHTFPFLKEIKKTNENNISTNMYNIAKCGLVKVNKENNGSLVLTYKISEPIA